MRNLSCHAAPFNPSLKFGRILKIKKKIKPGSECKYSEYSEVAKEIAKLVMKSSQLTVVPYTNINAY